MPHITHYNGIYFIEGSVPTIELGPSIECDLSLTIGAHLKSLNDVKQNLGAQAKEKGYNAVINFTYGQKASWLGSAGFFGKGILAKVK